MANFHKLNYYQHIDLNTNIVSGDSTVRVLSKTSQNFTFSADLTEVVITPTFDTGTDVTVDVLVNTLGLATGTYTAVITAAYGGQGTTANLHITVVDSSLPDDQPDPPVITPDVAEYSLKYWLEYHNPEGNLFRLEINQLLFSGTAKQIYGNVIHNYQSRKHLFEPIIASNLDIQLEADEELTLQDLYSENEREYLVSFYRDSQKLFYGFLKPDGIWEDFVYDRWQMTIDAIDGLSILKNLSFLQENGEPFKGTMTQYACVYYALKRIGFDLPINIDIRVFYEDFVGEGSILNHVKVNTQRFYQSDSKSDSEVMDCEAVLKSVLDLYNATIIQMNGEWYIYRTIDVAPVMTFHRYNGFEYDDEVIVNTAVNIGSHIDNFAIHHVNSNQKKSINASTQAYRINYKYGLTKSILQNSELEMGVGLSSEGWTFKNLNNIIARNEKYGIYVKKPLNYPLLGNPDDFELIKSDQVINVFEGDFINVIIRATGPLISGQKIFVKIETENFIYKDRTGWVAKPHTVEPQYHYAKVRTGYNEITYKLESIPEDSELTITIYGVKIDVPLNPLDGHYFEITGIDVVPDATDNIKGEFHTAQRKTRISSVVKGDKTVYNGDSLSDIFYGTLYKGDDTETEFWNREGQTEELSLLRINVEDNLRVSPRPMIFFEGDVYGFFPFLSLFTINNVPGNYQLSKYSFDTTSTIIHCSFMEFENAYLDAEDFRYEFDYDYGNETKVTISH